MSLVDTLMLRNEAFARAGYVPDLKMLPSLKTIIIGCVDPRVDPAEIFDLKPGEAAIIRNVGGRIFPSTLETLDLLTMVSKAGGGLLGEGWNVVLLHHTDCGIKRLAQPPDLLAHHFGVSSGELPGLAVMDPAASIAVDVRALTSDPRLSRDITVSGIVYDVATGRTTTVIPPRRLGGKA
jgi:carbonic anhydrase